MGPESDCSSPSIAPTGISLRTTEGSSAQYPASNGWNSGSGSVSYTHLLEFPYASGEAGDKGHVTLNWLTCETADTGELLVLEMLEHILLGLPGSPLRKALIESGLGEDLTGGGLETDLRQTFFSVGLRSITPGTAEDVEMLIMETLAELAENGIPAAAVEAAVNLSLIHI